MEQLYRLVKTNKRNPPNLDKRIMYVTMIKNSDGSIEPAFTPYFKKWETRGKYEVIEWFEPITQQ